MENYAKALPILMKSPVTDEMIVFLTRTTLKVVPNHPNLKNQKPYPSPPSSPSKEQQFRMPSLRTFITRLVRYTNVYTPTLLATACYLNKLRRILPQGVRGASSTIHRLFLSCLVLSAKYHNDSSPLNKHWAQYTDGLFSTSDINLMERQLLQLLNWDLRITEEDLILDLQPLLEPIKTHLELTSMQRKKMLYIKKQQQQQQLLLQQYRKGSPTPRRQRRTSVSSDASLESDSSASTLVNSNSGTPSPTSLKGINNNNNNGYTYNNNYTYNYNYNYNKSSAMCKYSPLSYNKVPPPITPKYTPTVTTTATITTGQTTSRTGDIWHNVHDIDNYSLYF